jgi:hypothetical protein
MHWQSSNQLICKSTYLFSLVLISGAIVFVGCDRKKNSLSDLLLTALPSPVPSDLAEVCIPDSQTGADCITDIKTSYTYSQTVGEYGGRSPMGSLNLPDSAIKDDWDGQLTVNIPEAYYEGAIAQVFDHNLLESVIKKDMDIFGTTGSLGALGYPDCTLGSKNVTTGSVIATCNLPDTGTLGGFNYTKEYGGRKALCFASPQLSENNSYINGPCWWDSNDVLGALYVSPIPPEVVTCSLDTSTGTLSFKSVGECRLTSPVLDATIGSYYYYTQSAGGRSRDCVLGGSNNISCFISGGTGYVAENLTVCTSGTINSTPCLVDTTGYYFYSTPYGGRTNCSSNNGSGLCWVDDSFVNFSGVETGTLSYLRSANIKVGKKVFGVEGSFLGDSYEWGSGLQRAVNSGTFMSYNSEKDLSANLDYSSQFHPVPQITAASADHDKDPLVTTATINKVDRTAWGAITCGTTGSIANRLTDCAVQITGGSASWDGKVKGNAGQGIWNLVSRTCPSGQCYEAWQDYSTGLIWSSLVTAGSIGTNWCKGTGNNASATSTEDLRDADSGTICTNALYQENTNEAYSACLERTGVFSTADSSFVQNGKSGLTSSLAPTNGRVLWRVPTIYDYILANHNGLRFVMPDIKSTNLSYEWTATTYSLSRNRAWAYDNRTGTRSIHDKIEKLNVRCIGR